MSVIFNKCLKITLLLLVVTVLLQVAVSCKRDPAAPDNQNLVPYLTVSPENLNILADPGIVKICISSNYDWIVTSDQNWLILNKTTGIKNDSITINYSLNSSTTENRTAVLSFYISDKLKKTINVNQFAWSPTLIVSPSNQNVDVDAGIINIQVTSNINWSASSNQSWCTVDPLNDSASGNATVMYSKNTVGFRTATITFSGSGVDAQILTISQKEGLITDINGNTYNVVKIGTQYWLDRNLAVTNYRNGDEIPDITDGSTWAALTDGAYCYYNNASSNNAIYGKLYNWYAVTDSRNIAPTGWHIPTDYEWTTLNNYLGGESVAGGKLKEVGIAHWQNPNTGATNETGFTALPGGYRNSNGIYNNIGYAGNWWSSGEYVSTSAWYRNVYYNNSNLFRYYYNKKVGFSVRCIRD